MEALILEQFFLLFSLSYGTPNLVRRKSLGCPMQGWHNYFIYTQMLSRQLLRWPTLGLFCFPVCMYGNAFFQAGDRLFAILFMGLQWIIPDNTQFIVFSSRNKLCSEIILKSFSVVAWIIERTVEPRENFRESLLKIHSSGTLCPV